ncbi:glycosyltransferase family 4 protein [Flavobacterium sp.]|uniref:glycosyltransferase family 4 protein n=1 Tax=Flavobacterium sp. TaxID=239 RepID=UPI00122067EB|nr:glycosyltransferase [Flavobacterium sp.]RZJ70869.1 MAG: glycosyltransferase [Flavobacterium sp.]
MKFAIITHTPHKKYEDRYFGYGPYVREMNVWGEFVDEVEIVAPLRQADPNAIDLAYSSKNIRFTAIPGMDLLSAKSFFKAVLSLPIVFFRIVSAMRRADHIHLRCPGNIGLVGCVAQIFFPSKPKTAKYAGNWDPKAAQPRSYRVQKWLLNNTLLTKNMQVLVYGKWEGSSKNIKPFFTATYRDDDKQPIAPRIFSDGIRLLFVGSLAAGKRPSYAIELTKSLREKGIDATLDLFGEGKERPDLENYISDNKLSDYIRLRGNHAEPEIREAYKNSHFLLLPSKSEGWPKVVAEAMFWASVPVSTRISCVSWMLGQGERGVLLDLDLDKDVEKISGLVGNPEKYAKMAANALNWSREYTLDEFRNAIKKLVHEEK